MSQPNAKRAMLLLGAMAAAIVIIVVTIAVAPNSTGPTMGGPETWDAATRDLVETKRQKALDHLRTGQHEQTRALLTQLADRYPQDPTTRIELAKVIYSLGDKAAAYEQMKIAISLDDQSAGAFQFAGELATMLEQYEQAKSHYEAALQLDPAAPQYALRLAGVHLRLKQPDAARLYALRVLKADPTVHQAYGILASIAADQGKVKLALQQVDKAIEQARKPTTIKRYKLWKATYLRRDNQPRKALALLQALGPGAKADDEVIREMAQSYLQMSEPLKAAKLWADVAAHSPGHAEAAAEAGLCFWRARDLRNARHYLALARRINPDHPSVMALEKALSEE